METRERFKAAHDATLKIFERASRELARAGIKVGPEKLHTEFFGLISQAATYSEKYGYSKA